MRSISAKNLLINPSIYGIRSWMKIGYRENWYQELYPQNFPIVLKSKGVIMLSKNWKEEDTQFSPPRGWKFNACTVIRMSLCPYVLRRTMTMRPGGGEGTPYKVCVSHLRRKSADIGYKFLMMCRPAFMKKGYFLKNIVFRGHIFRKKDRKTRI